MMAYVRFGACWNMEFALTVGFALPRSSMQMLTAGDTLLTVSRGDTDSATRRTAEISLVETELGRSCVTRPACCKSNSPIECHSPATRFIAGTGVVPLLLSTLNHAPETGFSLRTSIRYIPLLTPSNVHSALDWPGRF